VERIAQCPMEAEELWVVVPAYNEEASIADVIAGLFAHVRNVVVIDDSSTDHTWNVARSTGAAVLRHPINLGQGAALQTGIEYAISRGAQYVATFDADGQHDANDLETMFRELKRSESDVALGSRFLGSTSGMPMLRRHLLRASVAYTNLALGLNLTDTHNGLRIMNRKFLQSFQFRQNRMAHASEILKFLARSPYTFIEVPVVIRYTTYSIRKGQSSLNALRIVADLIFWRHR
jgi:polyprenyl-phospho-N-acetylgalactosaminyl synthase